jgi:hypothetical protein
VALAAYGPTRLHDARRRHREVGMRTIARRLMVAMLLAGTVGHGAAVFAAPWEELSRGRRALYTAGAVAANTLPVASSVVEPKCLPPYILCKLVFAAFSVVAAGESLVMSGGSDRDQPRAILHSGFSGDWYLTPRDVSGETKAEVLPAAPPPAQGDEKKEGEFVPPPL